MSYLRNHCLGRQPMTHEEVNAIYKSGKCPDLCMSHERLRAELAGLEIVATENEAIVDRLRARLDRVHEGYNHRRINKIEGEYTDCLGEELRALRFILDGENQ